MTSKFSSESVLKQYWGFDHFRPKQAEVIETVADGNDAVVIMPTGGGKSVCYQVPGLMKEGICIVVSPLIALMKDQVEQLTKRGIKAAAVFSGLSHREIDIMLDNAIYGDTKFLYISPERIETDMFRERVQKMQINLIAIDEAHCISQWGYDFRPSYMNIAGLRELLPSVPFIALTASATPEVQEDIVEKAGLNQPKVFRTSFKRMNLSYVARKVENKAAKLMEVLSNLGGSGIIYVRSRKKTVQLAKLLMDNGYEATSYHAGLKPDVRSERQKLWMDGEVPVMVSTNAFGMGIDKASVRFVIHWDIPESLEAYYQEAGRAGRDGKMSYAVLLYTPADLGRIKSNLTRKFPPPADIKSVYNALCNYLKVATGSGFMMSFDFDLMQFVQTFRLEMVKTYNILKILEQEGYLLLSDSIHLPSRLKFTINKKDLYRFQVEHEKWDGLVQALLRTYGGIMDHYITISEKYLSERLKVPVDKMKKNLLELKKKGVLNYIPYKTNPSLTFLKNRLEDRSIILNRDFWELRKKVAGEKATAILSYCKEEDECKQVFIATYFGEENATRCGKCSSCIAKKSIRGDEAIQSGKILRRLKPGEWKDVEEIVNGLGFHERDQVMRSIRHLAEEGKIILEDGKLVLRG